MAKNSHRIRFVVQQPRRFAGGVAAEDLKGNNNRSRWDKLTTRWKNALNRKDGIAWISWIYYGFLLICYIKWPFSTFLWGRAFQILFRFLFFHSVTSKFYTVTALLGFRYTDAATDTEELP